MKSTSYRGLNSYEAANRRSIETRYQSRSYSMPNMINVTQDVTVAEVEEKRKKKKKWKGLTKIFRKMNRSGEYVVQ